MPIVDQLTADLKQALLSGDKELVSVLRGIKSVILYEEVAQGKRDEGLTDPQIQGLLFKEVKKRHDAIALYNKGGNQERADQEKYEIDVIEKYLPAMMSVEEVETLVDRAIQSTEATSVKDMGKVMGYVKKESKGLADGSVVARIVKEKLG